MSNTVRKKHSLANHRRALFILMFAEYLMLLIYFLFFSEIFGRTVAFSEYRYNFEPFAEIKRYCTDMRNKNYLMFLINIVGNIVLFMPFGFLFPYVCEKENFKTGRFFLATLFATFVFVLAIETIQLVTKVGVFDVDDIIMNTFGSVMGYILYRIIRRNRIKTKKEQGTGNG